MVTTVPEILLLTFVAELWDHRSQIIHEDCEATNRDQYRLSDEHTCQMVALGLQGMRNAAL